MGLTNSKIDNDSQTDNCDELIRKQILKLQKHVENAKSASSTGEYKTVTFEYNAALSACNLIIKGYTFSIVLFIFLEIPNSLEFKEDDLNEYKRLKNEIELMKSVFCDISKCEEDIIESNVKV